MTSTSGNFLGKIGNMNSSNSVVYNYLKGESSDVINRTVGSFNASRKASSRIRVV